MDISKLASLLGKRGGEASKKQKPDYSAMGKRGMAKRWAGHVKKGKKK